MKLSVVVATLNDRERLLVALDSLSAQLGREDEVIVVNGPSTDGTTGAVRERSDVDVLVEISDRRGSVARNAGIEVATGDAIAFLSASLPVQDGWYDAATTALAAGTDVVTGPVKRQGSTADETEPVRVAGRTITHYSRGNVVFDHEVIDTLDGFDENLSHSSTIDAAHRVAANDFQITWSGDMAVAALQAADRPPSSTLGEEYRSVSYRLAKNYGPRPTVFVRTVGRALADGVSEVRGLTSGDRAPTEWFGNGVTVLRNTFGGLKDGLLARYRDRSAARNPSGVSSRQDRAVQVYDWR